MMAVISHSVLFLCAYWTNVRIEREKNRKKKKTEQGDEKRLTARPQLVSIHYLAFKKQNERTNETNKGTN